ncbi:MAG TPA: Ig domain-containing protein [Acidimicrobiia bacterium]|nr:Ig domain-containing protein [Acidimicrobiia bacterium]
MTEEATPTPDEVAAAQDTTSGSASEDVEVWTTAKKETRDVARWIATAMAAIGTVVFGAGPLTGSFSDITWTRVVVVIVGAVVGIAGLGTAIRLLADILAPTSVSLSELPKSFSDRITANPTDYFFDGSETVEHFTEAWTTRRKVERRMRDAVQRAKEDVAAADAAFKDAQPSQAVERKKELDSSQEALRAAENALADSKAWLEKYQARGRAIAAQGSFEKVRDTFHSKATWILVAAGAAALGGIAYVGALQAGEDEVADPTAAEPQLAEATFMSHEFVDAVGISRCLDESRVVVLKHGGQGTEAEPWDIETLPTTGCRASRFNATMDVVAIVTLEPQVSEVNITGGVVRDVTPLMLTTMSDRTSRVGDTVKLELVVDGSANLVYNDGNTLPPGLTIDRKTGEIEGSPTKAQRTAYDVAITITDVEQRIQGIVEFQWTIGD